MFESEAEADKPVTLAWRSKLQTVVALSSTEAEYINASETSRELQWLTQLLTELNVPYEKPVALLIDNKSAIELAKNSQAHQRTKHIRVAFHFVRQMLDEGIIAVEWVASEYNLADQMTKILQTNTFEKAIQTFF